MLRHHYVTHYHEAIASADFFENRKKQIAMARAAQQRTPLVATGGDEVKIVRAVVTTKTRWHFGTIEGWNSEVCDG